MKVIYLEADEEVTSVIERLREETSTAIAFVVPRGALLLQSAVNLRLLKREAARLKKEVSLVTLDRIGRNLASQAGFSVYSELKGNEPINEEAGSEAVTPAGVRVHRYRAPREEGQASLPEPEPPAPPRPARPSLAPHPGRRPARRSAALVIGLGLVLLILFLPSATVAIKLPTEPLTTEVVVKVDGAARSSDLDQQVLRGTFVEAEEVITERRSTSGKKNVGKKAGGTLIIASRSGGGLVVPSGSRFRTESGLFFRTTAEVSLPAASAKVTSGGEAIVTPGTAEASVEAEAPGSEYNLKGQSLSPVNVSGVASGVVTASVKGELVGGTTDEKPVVAQVDLDQLRAGLTESARTRLLERFKARVGEGALVLGAAIELEELGFEVNPAVGVEASEMSGSLKVRGSTLSFLESEYQALVVRSAKDQLRDDEALILSSEDEIAPQGVSFDRDRQRLEIQGSLRTKVGPKIEPRTIRSKLRLKSRAEAATILDELAPRASSTVRVVPAFLPRLPLLATRIEVSVEYE